MKRVGASGLLVLALSTLSVAQNLVPLDRGSQPFEAYGFSINAPPGADWLVDPAAEDHFVVFYRYVGKGKDRHTAIAGVRTNWVTDCNDHKSCLEKAAESASARVGDVAVTKFELSEDGVDEPTCRSMDKIEDDQRSRSFEVRVSGLLCTHPEAPQLVLQAAISERFQKGGSPTTDFLSNAKTFVETFEFRPLKVVLVSIIDVGEGSGYLEAVNDSLWIHGHKWIYHLDLDSRQAEQRFKSPSRVFPIAYDAESIWIPIGKKRQLLQLRPSDGAVQTTADLSIKPYTTKKGFGSLWITSDRKTSLVRVDPTSSKVIAEIKVGKGPSELAIGETSVWVTEHRTRDLIWRVDPATNSVVKSFQPCVDPVGIERGTRFLWVACNGDRKIIRIDPATYEESGSVEVGGSPSLIDSDATTVWLTHFDSRTVTAVDIETMKVIAHMPLGRAMLYVKVLDESTWVTDMADPNIYEIRRPDNR